MNFGPLERWDRPLNEANNDASEQFATARALADRWSCHVDTVYSRLAAAGVRQYRFSSRLIRWRWADVFAYEDALANSQPAVPQRSESAAAYKPRKKGPQRIPVKASNYE